MAYPSLWRWMLYLYCSGGKGENVNCLDRKSASLRIQLGLSMSDLELLSIGLINDMYCESRNDSCSYAVLGTQQDMDLF